MRLTLKEPKTKPAQVSSGERGAWVDPFAGACWQPTGDRRPSGKYRMAPRVSRAPEL
jgi:hypothetical protein